MPRHKTRLVDDEYEVEVRLPDGAKIWRPVDYVLTESDVVMPMLSPDEEAYFTISGDIYILSKGES